jgi:hypothetical protein
MKVSKRLEIDTRVCLTNFIFLSIYGTFSSATSNWDYMP